MPLVDHIKVSASRRLKFNKLPAMVPHVTYIRLTLHRLFWILGLSYFHDQCSYPLLPRSGWTSWKQYPNLLVSLPATKALCKLDQDYDGHKFEPGIYLLLPNDWNVQHEKNLSNRGRCRLCPKQDKDNEREFSDNLVRVTLTLSWYWPVVFDWWIRKLAYWLWFW